MEIRLNNKTLFKFSFTYDISKNIVTVNGDVLSQGVKQDTEDTTQESQITEDELVDISKVDIKEYCDSDGDTLLIHLMLSGKTWGIAQYEDVTDYSVEQVTESHMNRTKIAKPIIRNECFAKDLDNIVGYIKDTEIKSIRFIFRSHDEFYNYYYWLEDREIKSSQEFADKLMLSLDETPLSPEYGSKPILK